MLENLILTIYRHKSSTGEGQGKIGIRAGIVETRLSAIVHGRITPTPDERAALSKVLGVPEDTLFATEQVK